MISRFHRYFRRPDATPDELARSQARRAAASQARHARARARIARDIAATKRTSGGLSSATP